MSPMTNNIISIRNRLQCHFQERPDVTLENALNQSLFSYHSLEKCKLPKTNDSNATTGIKDGGSTETFVFNDNESTTESEIEVVVGLKPPNATKAETTRNDSKHYNEDLNGGTDNPKNDEVNTTPKRQEISEATGNSSTFSSEVSGDLNGGTDNQETPYSRSNQPLIINNISLIIAIFIASVVLAYVGYRLCGFLSRSPFERLIPK